MAIRVLSDLTDILYHSESTALHGSDPDASMFYDAILLRSIAVRNQRLKASTIGP
jgi:hypothetical protein